MQIMFMIKCRASHIRRIFTVNTQTPDANAVHKMFPIIINHNYLILIESTRAIHIFAGVIYEELDMK